MRYGPIDRRVALIRDPPLFEPDGAVPYMPTWSLCVPWAPGVYVVSDLRGPLYVGRTAQLRRRFYEHLDDSHNRLLRVALARPVGSTRFYWVLTVGKQAVMLEHYLISGLVPICNGSSGRPKRRVA